jgi:FKBP-type peptidyl-prolyl cis-trans isomerase FkpA
MRALLLVCVVGLAAVGCEEKVPEPTPEPRPAASRPPDPPEPADLIKEDLQAGSGAEAKTGDKVKVHYTGRLLKNNYMFDSSVGKKPFDVTIGAGGVIKGWDEGLVGMKVGGKRKLTIPSRLGYGDAGSPPKIPGKATLVFEIELLSIGDDPDAGAGDAGAKDAAKKDGGTKKDAPKKEGEAKKDPPKPKKEGEGDLKK